MNIRKETLYEVGQGCSRTAVLLKNGMICKKPRYNSDYSYAAPPDTETLHALMEEFHDDRNVNKITNFLKAGYALPIQCSGNLMEYLISLKFRDTEFADLIALCVGIQVRRNSNLGTLDIKTFYENAGNSHQNLSKENLRLLLKEFPYCIDDLHDGNIVNGKIVDYAAIEEKKDWDF